MICYNRIWKIRTNTLSCLGSSLEATTLYYCKLAFSPRSNHTMEWENEGRFSKIIVELNVTV